MEPIRGLLGLGRPSRSRRSVIGATRPDRSEIWPPALGEGQGGGRLVGGNLCTLNLLQGPEFMPSLEGAVLLIDDAASDVPTFARDLTSLLQLPDAGAIAGLVVGRFQVASGMTRAVLDEIVSRQQALRGAPELANVDHGHTNPLATLPIGGTAQLSVGARCPLRVSHRWRPAPTTRAYRPPFRLPITTNADVRV